MRLPVNPGDLLTAALAPGAREPGLGLGEHMLRTVLGAWEVPEMRSTFLGLLRSAVTSEQAAGMLREFATEAILSRIAGAVQATAGGCGQEAGPGGPEPGPGGPEAEPAAGPDAQFRAALVASQVLGLALTRYVLELGPLVRADVDELATAIGPTLERYLTGQLGLARVAPTARPVIGLFFPP
jgi:hypothetical protein